ncbi:MAG: SpoIIE family protein phosphatase [Bacteroidales bacterium]|jgi:serine phosphatase RsbU (regulator of sigma subunit)|nr:SpoIIE family protein phosphatase [Bacteroidales bacterium]
MITKVFKYYLFLLILISGTSFGQQIPDNIKAELDSYEEQIAKFKNEGNKSLELEYSNKAAFLCWNNQVFDQAIKHFENVLDLNKSLNNNNGILMATNYLGMIYNESEKYTKAIEYFKSGISISKSLKNKPNIVSGLINIAQTYQLSGNYEESNKSSFDGINLSKELNDIKSQRTFYGIVAENYQKLGNSGKSIEYFDLFASLDKFIKNQEITDIKTQSASEVNKAHQEKAITEQELNKQTDKLKKTEDSLAVVEELTREQKMQLELKESQIKAQEAQLKLERLWRSILIYGFIAILIIAGLLLFLYRKIRTQKFQIEDQRDKLDLQNKKINSSIQYAQNIQQAILPTSKQLDKHFEYFLTYKPKDIVSGDFYWYVEFNNRVYIASIDCTGHGVPGAFMSMIGSRLLNEIVIEKNILDPAKILSTLNDKIITALRQNETENEDGMDVCLLCFEDINQKNKAIYTGAKRTLLIYRSDKKSIEEIKGDRLAIGGSKNENRDKDFTSHSININKGDIVFLSSDGLTDQNNADRKRFGSQRLNDLVINNSHKNLIDLKAIIESELENFKQGEEQRDDITLIGLKIK